MEKSKKDEGQIGKGATEEATLEHRPEGSMGSEE